MPQKEEAARPDGTGQSGKDTNGVTDTTIVSLADIACTAVAILAHELLYLAANTDDANITRLALHADRSAIELHFISQLLPAALIVATDESEVAA